MFLRKPLKITIGSLFTGGGLVECGAHNAGITPIWGIDANPLNSKLSAATSNCYENNFNSFIIHSLIQNIYWNELIKPDILWASPPCTRVSSANYRPSYLARGEGVLDMELAHATCKAIETIHPKVFCLENVKAYAKTYSFSTIISTLNNLGYTWSYSLENAANYGVPQIRIRLILRAIFNQDLPRLPKPKKHVGWYGTIADLLPDLPDSKLTPHQVARLSENLPENILIERTGARGDRPLHIRHAGQPCWTIRASIGTDQRGNNRTKMIDAHLTGGRIVSLDARCLARLMSVPDWYVLPSEVRYAVPLIGQGVPPLMAEQLLGDLVQVL